MNTKLPEWEPSDGETIVRATKNGRKITLDPIQEVILNIPWREVESTIPCGFQQPWVDGDKNGESFCLKSGAGAGSPWATFSYKGHHYCINAKDIIVKLIDFTEETIAKEGIEEA